jgi:hypothetical protein
MKKQQKSVEVILLEDLFDHLSNKHLTLALLQNTVKEILGLTTDHAKQAPPI